MCPASIVHWWIDNMLLTDILGPLGWRITDGGEHGWNCYGEGCRSIELGDDHRDGLYIYLVFDPKTLRVFEVTGHGPIYELTENNPWRWIDAEYQSSFRNECTRRRIKWQQAWDDVMYSEVNDEDLIRLIHIGAGHLDTILAEKNGN